MATAAGLRSDASLRIDQHLLQGFGRANNMYAIHIARNKSKIADLTFRQQVIRTVTQVLGLYCDLVSFQDQEFESLSISDGTKGWR